MSTVVGSVTANLILNSTGFTDGMKTAMNSVKEINQSLKGIGTGNGASKQVEELVKGVNSIATNFDKVAKNIEKVNAEQEKFKQKQKEISDIRLGEKLYKEYEEYRQELTKVREETIKTQEAMARYDKNAGFLNPIIEGANKAVEALEKLNGAEKSVFDQITENASKANRAVTKFHEAMSGKSIETNLAPIVEEAQKAIAVLKRMGDTGKSTFEQITENAHKARSALNKFTELNSGKSLESNLKPVIENAQKAVKEFERLRQEAIKSNEEKAFQGIIDNAQKAVKSLQQVQEQMGRTESVFSQMNARMSGMSGLGSLNPLLGNTTQKLSNLSSTANTTTGSFTGLNKTTETTGSKISTLNGTFGNGINNVRTLGATYNTTSGQMNKFGTSTSNTNNRLKEHWSQLYRLTSALHSLKVVLSTVSSMFIWTFGMSIWEATKQTISSKNEMTSYLEQMGKGTGEIRSFNAGLDETVSKFKKLNKYMIGETIAGIGAEFDLSIDEMKKSMEVVAMIQNEYVRAGRKESEASLAVKDILQGEFLRLSRETGVGKQDLIDTGKWQGDLKDVMGLMEALKEVGESRHWDLFASKCRSLNDVISATRNRISEFTATLIDEASPAIVGAFNAIIDVVDGATNAFNNMGVFEKMLVGVGAFYALSTALMVVAGNVNLLDIAMYGYSNSLLATIFRVDVATVKEYGLGKALLAKATNLQASTVAEIGNAKAIMTRLLGLDASIVKEYGLKTAIATAITMKNADSASTDANTASIMLNNTTMDLSTIGYSLNSEATEANTIAKGINENANLGVWKTLVMMVTGMEAEKVANMGATASLYAFITATTVLETLTIVGAIFAIAVAFGTLAKRVMDTCARMKEYNDLIANSEDTIQALKDAYQEMENERANLDSQYYNGTLSADEYNQKLKELYLTTEDLTNASNELAEAIDNIEYAGKFSKTIENKKMLSAIRNGNDLANVMKDQHFDDADIKDAKWYKSLVDFGNERLYKGLQVYNKQSSDFIENEKTMVAQLEKNKIPKEEQLNWIKDLNTAYADLEEHSFIANTSDDWWEASWNSLYAGMDQLKIDWINFWADPDFEGAIAGFIRGLGGTGFGGFGSLDKLGLSEWLANFDFDSYWGNLTEWFNNSPFAQINNIGQDFYENVQKPLEDAVNGFMEWAGSIDIWKMITDWFNNDVLGSDLVKQAEETVNGWWQGIQDAVGNFFNGDGTGSGGGIAKKIDPSKLINAIFGEIDVSQVSQWVTDTLITPLSDAINNIISDPLGSLMLGAGELGVWQFLDAIFGQSGGSDEAISWSYAWVDMNIVQPLKLQLDMFLQDPIGYMGGLLGNMGTLLTGLLSGDSDIYTTMYTWVTDNIVTPFSQSIQTGLLSVPIVGDILAFLGLADSPEVTTTADQKGQNVGWSFGSAVESKIRSIPILGDVLSWLGVIDGANPTANQKGHNVGKNVHDGVDSGKTGTADLIRSEMDEVINAVSSKIASAYATAQQIGSSILNGINSILQHHSPGVTALLVADEMMEIVLAMANAKDSVFASAQEIGTAITSGIQPNTDISFDAQAMAEYQANSMMAMGMADETVNTTESAFSELDYSTMTTFGNIGTTIGTTMTNIASTTKMKYTDIANTTKLQLTNMQSQTTKNISAIRTSWTGMQTALINSAEHIRSETGAKIHSLQNNMASFWRKVQNPALLLGAGSPSEDRGRKTRYSSHGSGVRKVLSPKGFAGSPSLSRSNSNPRGARTGTGITDKLPNRTVNGIKIYDILSQYIECLEKGEPCYAGGGWNFNWSKDIKDALMKWHTHFGQIYDPYLYVGKFENDTFPVRGIAPIAKNYIYDAISRTSYEYYMGEKYGSPLATWNAGHFNCYDGALLVMALASAFGFPNSTMVHGSWGGIPHVWARIAGLGDIDATAIQGHYGFTAPSRTGAGGDVKPRFKHNGMSNQSNGNTINGDINITINGVDKDSDEIGREVRNSIIDLFSPNPATGQ